MGDDIDVDVMAAVTTMIDAVCWPDEFDDADDDDDGCRPTISFASAKLDCWLKWNVANCVNWESIEIEIWSCFCYCVCSHLSFSNTSSKL